ncbi:MAG: COG4223 family protein [Pseudorhodoplanes sp.]
MIDLKATDVTPEPAVEAAGSASSPPPETPEPDPQPRENPASSSAQANAPRAARSGGAVAAIMAAVAFGAVGVGIAVTMLAFWFAGLLPPHSAPPAGPDLSQNVAQLESQSRETTARLSQIESSLSGRLAASEGASRAGAEQYAALSRRIDELAIAAREARGRAEAAVNAAAQTPQASRAEIEALANRLSALERNMKAAGDDRAARLAAVALSLRSAVESGDPFANELAAAQALARDPATLAPLRDFAQTGIPRASLYARELSALAPRLHRNVAPPAEGGFIGRLQQNAERLVRIRPIADTAGDDAASVIGRVEFKSAQNDLAGALADLRKLPADIRAPAEDWIRRVEQRNAAIAAAKQFAANALAALAKPAS